jgi:hypothetical protein
MKKIQHTPIWVMKVVFGSAIAMAGEESHSSSVQKSV